MKKQTHAPSMALTANEYKMLKAIVDHDEYGEKGNMNNVPWSWAVCGDKSRGATLGRLVAKGLAGQQGSGNDATCWLTVAGKRKYLAYYGDYGIDPATLPEDHPAYLPQ